MYNKFYIPKTTDLLLTLAFMPSIYFKFIVYWEYRQKEKHPDNQFYLTL